MLHYKENFNFRCDNIFSKHKDKEKFIRFIFEELPLISLDKYNFFLNECISDYYEKRIYPQSYLFLQSIAQRRKLRQTKEHKLKVKRESTKCYILKDNNTNTYKIGASINPLKREKTLQSQKPNLKLIKIFENNIEKELHELYKHCRLRGEWFELNKVQLQYICKKYK
jgi:hypothetical protein